MLASTPFNVVPPCTVATKRRPVITRGEPLIELRWPSRTHIGDWRHHAFIGNATPDESHRVSVSVTVATSNTARSMASVKGLPAGEGLSTIVGRVTLAFCESGPVRAPRTGRQSVELLLRLLDRSVCALLSNDTKIAST